MSDLEAGMALSQGRTGPQPHFSRLNRAFEGDRGPWLGAVGGLWIAGAAASAAGALGAPTGFGAWIDVVSAVAMQTTAFAVFALLAAWALAFVPRFSGPFGTIGGLLYTGALAFFLLHFSDMGIALPLILACAYTLLSAAAGWLLFAAVARGTGRRLRTAAVLALALGCGTGAWLAAPSIIGPEWFGGSADDADLDKAADEEGVDGADARWASSSAAGAAFKPLNTGDPSLPGSYVYETFTYGSGADRRRDEFGADAKLISKPADASAYLKGWPLLRKWFWGFGPKALPLNGRVWMPEGDGAFPLVLIVHGNHAMEDFSDAGYAYLGEQLASRGFVAVSVDENFLNYSVWSGIPDQDMELRAWLLLKHIGQLRDFEEDPSSPLYGKLDLQKTALVGHSRGGQAVAMAADRDAWFAQDGTLPSPSDYRIVSVAAIAPTDTLVDSKQAMLRDVSYLTLQGSADADINDFFGDRQYGRVSFTSEADGAFKASLYIADANHGQFNASWGRRDSSLPAGLFLRKPELTAREQQQIAKIYLTAFMEATLHGELDYEPLFEDYRSALPYLPDTAYVSRYEGSDFRPIARFDGEGANADRPGQGLSGDAKNGAARVEEALDRQRRGKGTRGLAFEWTTAGVYTMKLGRTLASEAGGSSPGVLSFALADLSRDLNEWDREAAADDLRIGLADASGVYVEIPLDRYASPEPLFRTSITWLGRLERLFDEGKYEEKYEPVFQTYRIPLAAWRLVNPKFNPAKIAKLSFVLDDGPGKIMVDDIGIAPL